MALLSSSGGVGVSVEGVKFHRGTSISLRPLTVLLGSPGSGKSSFARSVYLGVWLVRGRRADVLVPAVLSPAPSGFCVGLGGCRVCWGEGGVSVSGESPPWRGAVLLPCDYYTKLKALYEIGVVASAVANGVARAAGLGVLLGVAMRLLGESSFLGGMGLLAADLFYVYGGEFRLTPLAGVARVVRGETAVVSRALRGVDPLHAPSSVIARRVLVNLLLDAPRGTLIVLEEPLLAVLGGLGGEAGEAAERIRRGDVWLLVTLSLPGPGCIGAVREFVAGLGLRGVAALYNLARSGEGVSVTPVAL